MCLNMRIPGPRPPPPRLSSCYRVAYTPLPGPLVKQPGLSPAQLSALNLDPSPLLAQLLAEGYGGQGQLLLGEMQYAFLAFLLAASLAGGSRSRGRDEAVNRPTLLSLPSAVVHNNTSHTCMGACSIVALEAAYAVCSDSGIPLYPAPAPHP